jgi:hypothetical protein
MQPDPEYLRRHYAALSDDALLAMKRTDLVDVAQKVFDAEIEKRGLARQSKPDRQATPRPAPPTPVVDDHAEADGPSEQYTESYVDGDRPEWAEEAAEVYSAVVLPGRSAAEDVAECRAVLDAAGFPCYMELIEEREEKIERPRATQRWRLMVPGELNLQAVSTLERDRFNEDFEAEWKAHLETLDDDQVLAMTPETVFCGLFDRVERVTRAYEEEIARRGLAD